MLWITISRAIFTIEIWAGEMRIEILRLLRRIENLKGPLFPTVGLPPATQRGTLMVKPVLSPTIMVEMVATPRLRAVLSTSPWNQNGRRMTSTFVTARMPSELPGMVNDFQPRSQNSRDQLYTTQMAVAKGSTGTQALMPGLKSTK